MGAIGWIWAWAMLMAAVRAHIAHSLPQTLVWAIAASGIVALPILWSKKDGIFGDLALSGIVRAGLSITILLAGGVAYPQAIMGLIA